MIAHLFKRGAQAVIEGRGELLVHRDTDGLELALVITAHRTELRINRLARLFQILSCLAANIVHPNAHLIERARLRLEMLLLDYRQARQPIKRGIHGSGNLRQSAACGGKGLMHLLSLGNRALSFFPMLHVRAAQADARDGRPGSKHCRRDRCDHRYKLDSHSLNPLSAFE